MLAAGCEVKCETFCVHREPRKPCCNERKSYHILEILRSSSQIYFNDADSGYSKSFTMQALRICVGFFSMDFYFFGMRDLLFFLIGCTWTRVLMCYIDICDVWDNFNIALGLQRRLLFWTKWLSRQNNRDEGLLSWHPRSAECIEQVSHPSL